MTDTPLGRARLELIWARERLQYKDTPLHREQMEEARDALDALLDALPRTPTGPGAQPPGPVVSFPSIPPALAEELMEHYKGEQHP